MERLHIKFDILSLNVRGICNNKKRLKVFNWLKNHTGDKTVVFLKETHSTSDTEHWWSRQWQHRDSVFLSHGEHNAHGTLIAFRENISIEIEDKAIGKQGRYVILKCLIQDSPFLLVNFYNPNNEVEQVKTMEKVRDIIENLDPTLNYNLVLGRDLNFIQDTVYDSDGGTPTLKHSSIAELRHLQSQRDLVDIWRIRNPSVKRFTYRQHKLLIKKKTWLLSHMALLTGLYQTHRHHTSCSDWPLSNNFEIFRFWRVSKRPFILEI